MHRITKQHTFIAAFAAVALFAAIPFETAQAQQVSTWKEYKARATTHIDANARFREASKISVNYQIKPQVIHTDDEQTSIAQIAINLSETSAPLTMSCDIQTNRKQAATAFADEITSSPCIDVAQTQSTQLLQGGDNYIRRIRVNSSSAQEAKQANDTMVLNFSYL